MNSTKKKPRKRPRKQPSRKRPKKQQKKQTKKRPKKQQKEQSKKRPKKQQKKQSRKRPKKQQKEQSKKRPKKQQNDLGGAGNEYYIKYNDEIKLIRPPNKLSREYNNIEIYLDESKGGGGIDVDDLVTTLNDEQEEGFELWGNIVRPDLVHTVNDNIYHEKISIIENGNKTSHDIIVYTPNPRLPFRKKDELISGDIFKSNINDGNDTPEDEVLDHLDGNTTPTTSSSSSSSSSSPLVVWLG